MQRQDTHSHPFLPNPNFTYITNHRNDDGTIPFITNSATYLTVPQFNRNAVSVPTNQHIQPQFHTVPVMNPTASSSPHSVTPCWVMSNIPHPVGTNPTDEFVLLTALRASDKKPSVDYKAVLESLHGVSTCHSHRVARLLINIDNPQINSHTADDWKDYFLQHVDRLSLFVRGTPDRAQNIPASAEVQIGSCSHSIVQRCTPQDDSSHERSVDLDVAIKGALRKNGDFKPTSLVPSARHDRGSTSQNRLRPSRLNNDASGRKGPQTYRNPSRKKIESHAPLNERDHGTAHNVHTVISSQHSQPASRHVVDLEVASTPSRSPTPPDRIQRCSQTRHKFTEEDGTYFVKFVHWRLKNNPDITATEVCKQISENVSGFL